MLARDPDAEVRLYDALRDSFARDERTGIHLSSLLNPMQEHWRRALGRPPLTNAEIGYFTAGRGHEDILTKLLESDFVSTPEEEIDGIHCRPDFIAVTDRVIPKGSHAELKTRRANLPKSDADAQTAFESYRAQVRGYMALKRQNEMYLIVLSLTEGKTRDPLSTSAPVIAVYKEVMTDEELEQTRQELRERRGYLENGRVDRLPLCWSFLCGRWSKIKVGKEVTWLYLPKCPYYADCQPQLRDPKRGMRDRPEPASAEAGSPGICS